MFEKYVITYTDIQSFFTLFLECENPDMVPEMLGLIHESCLGGEQEVLSSTKRSFSKSLGVERGYTPKFRD